MTEENNLYDPLVLTSTSRSKLCDRRVHRRRTDVSATSHCGAAKPSFQAATLEERWRRGSRGKVHGLTGVYGGHGRLYPFTNPYVLVEKATWCTYGIICSRSSAMDGVPISRDSSVPFLPRKPPPEYYSGNRTRTSSRR